MCSISGIYAVVQLLLQLPAYVMVTGTNLPWQGTWIKAVYTGGAGMQMYGVEYTGGKIFFSQGLFCCQRLFYLQKLFFRELFVIGQS